MDQLRDSFWLLEDIEALSAIYPPAEVTATVAGLVVALANVSPLEPRMMFPVEVSARVTVEPVMLMDPLYTCPALPVAMPSRPLHRTSNSIRPTTAC